MKMITIIAIVSVIASPSFARPVVVDPGYRNPVVVNPARDDIRGVQAPDGLSVDERRAWNAAHPNVGPNPVINNAIDRRNAAIDDLDD